MKHLHRSLAALAALVLLVTMLPLSVLAETLQVSPSSLNLRTSPSTQSQVVAVYQRGTKVTVLGTSGKWTRVRTPDGKTGYMLTSYLKKASSSTPKATPTPKADTGKAVSYYAYVKTASGSNVILRSAASTAAASLGNLPVGTRVQVTREYTSGWRQVKTGGKTGYVLSNYLTRTKPASAPAATPEAGRAVNYYAYAYTASGSRVVLRSSPASTGTALRLLDVGTQLRVTREGLNGWCQVNVNGMVGYIMSSYLTRTNPNKKSAAPVTANYVAYVKSSNGSPVNFRTGPGTGYNIIGQAPSGTQITVVSQKDGWCFIRIGSVYGYMSVAFISRNVP